MDLKEIQNLIKFVAKSGTSEVRLETDDFKITIKTGSGDSGTTVVQHTAVPMQQPTIAAAPQEVAPVQAAIPSETVSEDSKYITWFSSWLWPISDSAYKILELDSNATISEIKKA
jgi:acetyl-CoA carboxylase biotin carboxyl carrier protein